MSNICSNIDNRESLSTYSFQDKLIRLSELVRLKRRTLTDDHIYSVILNDFDFWLRRILRGARLPRTEDNLAEAQLVLLELVAERQVQFSPEIIERRIKQTFIRKLTDGGDDAKEFHTQERLDSMVKNTFEQDIRNALPTEERQILWLMFAGFTRTETCKMVGCSQWQYNKAIALAKDLLAK